MPDTSWRVAEADDPRLAEAILRAVEADADRIAWIRAGAIATIAEVPADADAARRFQTMLELAYLVASADGFAPAERVSLAALLERMTGAAVDHAALELHFRDLDDAVAALGRRERLARAAAELGDDAGEAIGLVAIVALADGQLGAPELEALIELGRHVGIGADRIRSLAEAAVTRVGAQLR